MNKYSLIFFLILAFAIKLSSQSVTQFEWSCGADLLEKIENPYGTIPDGNMLYFEKKWQKAVKDGGLTPMVPDEKILPVVFHIIHKNGPENIADSRIIDGLEYLNNSFANSLPYDQNGNEANIKFCLATQDPDGFQTSGITRVVSDFTSMTMESDDSALKSLTNWPTSCYVNVWIVNSITSISSGPGVAGYATFPGAHGMFNDGIVMEYPFLGQGPEENSVLTHEMGHYLGLYHTFQGGCGNDDCTIDGDRVCDTPPDESTSYIPCNSTMNTCDTDADSGFPSDVVDLHQDFMDYSDFPCYYLFTNQQIDRMHLAIDEVRSSLLACPSCIVPCAEPVVADFDLSTYSGQVGIDITSTNNSMNGVTYEWYVDGTFYSNLEQPVFNFLSEGVYKIRLVVTGADSECLDITEKIVEVSCNISMNILPSLKDCYTADSILNFTFSDPDATNIEWFINDGLFSTAFTMTNSFAAGVYKITVHVWNTECDKTVDFFLPIGCNEICDNGFDDDGDGLIDCYDPDCCEECGDYYFDACFADNTCPIEYDEFGITVKWELDKYVYPVYNVIGGDVDQDGKAEILAVCCQDFPLFFVDDNGNIKYNLDGGSDVQTNFGATIADYDQDGEAELYYIDVTYHLVCMKLDGSVVFTSAEPFTDFFGTLASFLFAADIDYDGTPEIIIGNDIFDGATGELLVKGDDNIFSKGTLKGAIISEEGHIVVTNMLDDDIYPGLEIVTGNQILTVDLVLGTLTKAVELPNRGDGAVAVADWDRDGDLDVIVASNGLVGPADKLIIWDGQTGAILEELTGAVYTSVPTILNLDDDDELEIVVNSQSNFKVNIVAHDHDMSEIWLHNVDEISFCPSVGFDFNGDGKNHIILRSFTFLEVISGETGEILFKSECGSVTNNEHPIILDIDGDGHAEIVTVCDGTLTAYEGFPEEWAPTRTVWNQYYFMNTVIDDNLIVPQVQQMMNLPNPNQGLNSAMTAFATLKKDDFYDFNLTNFDYSCNDDGVVLEGKVVYESGKSNVDFDMPYAIYTGSPADVETLLYGTGNVNVSNTTVNGDTIYFSILIPLADLGFFGNLEMCIIVNDPGTQLPFNYENDIMPDELEECKYKDNYQCIYLTPFNANPLDDKVYKCEIDSVILEPEGEYETYMWIDGSTDSILVVYGAGEYWVEVTNECGLMVRDTIFVDDEIPVLSLDLGPDLTMCDGGIVTFEADEGYESYKWPDGTDSRKYSAWLPGKYWVEATDFCGVITVDTILVSLEELSMDLVDTIELCVMGDYTVVAEDFTHLLVNDPDFINCADCNEVILTQAHEGWVELIGIDEKGCSATDSILIVIISNPIYYDTATICDVQFNYKDTVFYAPGDYVFQDTMEFCDTTFLLHLVELEDLGISYDYDINCSPLFANLNIYIEGSGTYSYEWNDGTTEPTLNEINGGTWDLTITDENDCEVYWSETFLVLTDFTYSLQDTYEIEINDPLILEVLGDSVGAKIDWMDIDVACDSCFINTVFPKEDWYVTIFVVDSNGCETELRTFIDVNTDRPFYFGNVFTPNADGINDKFYLQDGEHVEHYSLEIYDRWGSKVFNGIELQPNDSAVGWDGKHMGSNVKAGVYAYVVEVLFNNGTVVQKRGDLTIFR